MVSVLVREAHHAEASNEFDDDDRRRDGSGVCVAGCHEQTPAKKDLKTVANLFQVGKTTQQDIDKFLGEPGYKVTDSASMYRYENVLPGDVPKSHVNESLTIWFDENGKLRSTYYKQERIYHPEPLAETEKPLHVHIDVPDY